MMMTMVTANAQTMTERQKPQLAAHKQGAVNLEYGILNSPDS